MLELVKGAVMGILDLKTKTAKYRSVICIIWFVPKRKSKVQSFKNSSKMGSLLVLMSIFANPAASAEVLRLVRWPTVSFAQRVESRSM